MTKDTHEEPVAEETLPKDAQEQPDASATEDQDVGEIEQELLDAMKSLRRKNKKVEEYLDGLARDVEKNTPQQTESPPE